MIRWRMPRWPRDRAAEDRLLETAWGIIANAGWDAGTGQTTLDKTEGWHGAAIRWRDDYFRFTRGRMTA